MDYEKNRGRGRGRGKARGGKSDFRGRGGYRGRGNSRATKNLESNEWRFEDNDQNEEIMVLRKATIDACSKQLPMPQKLPDISIPEEQILRISKIIATLSLEDQINHNFLVPLPPLASDLPKNQSKPEDGTKTPCSTESEMKPEENLESWLDNLLA